MLRRSTDGWVRTLQRKHCIWCESEILVRPYLLHMIYREKSGQSKSYKRFSCIKLHWVRNFSFNSLAISQKRLRRLVRDRHKCATAHSVHIILFTYMFDGFACHSTYASVVCLQSHANFRYTSQGGRRTTLRCGFYSVRSWLTGTDFEVRNPQHTHSTKYTHPIGHCTIRIMA